MLFKVLRDNKVRVDNSLLSHCKELVVGLSLFLNLIAIGKGLLTVELIFLDQIGPCFLAPLLSRLILCHFLAQVDQLGALLFEHLFAVGTVSVGAQVSFAFNFSLHEHLFETANLGLLVSDFRW